MLGTRSRASTVTDTIDPGSLFVAYPREERDFVRSLSRSLEEAGRKSWWDDEIEPREDWRAIVDREIRGAAALVFVLTPGSLDPARECRRELDVAVDAGLPVVVVQRADVPREGRPPALETPHWVSLRPEDPYEQGVADLVKACSADLEWNAGRSLVQTLALQWEAHERDPSRLLRGASLEHAEQWQARRRPEHQGPPLEVVGRFVAASQAAARQARRRRTYTLSLVGTALVALVVVSLISLHSAQVQRGHAQDQSGKARHQARVAESLALATLGANQPPDRSYAALALGYEAFLESDSAEARRTILEAFQPTGPPALVTVLHGHQDVVSDGAYSPDGLTIATVSGDRTARLWDADSGHQLHVLTGHTEAVEAVAFSPDGRRLATTGADHTVRLWDVRSGRQVLKRDTPAQFPTRVVFGAGGDTVAASGQDGPAAVWDTATGHRLAMLRHTPRPEVSTHIDLDAAEPVFPLAVSPDGKLFVTGGEDALARVWDARTGRRVAVFDQGSEAAAAFAFSSDSRLLATAGYDHSVRVWNLATRERMATLRGHARAVMSLSFSRDASTIFAAARDRAALVWNVRTGKQAGRVLGVSDSDGRRVTGAQYSPDGRLAATADGNGTIRLFALGMTDRSVTLSGHGASISALRFSGDSRRLLTASSDGTVRVWDTRGAFSSQLVGHDYPIRSVAISPDGRLIATGSDDFRVGLWDPRTGRRLRWLVGHRGPVVAIAFSPDGTRLLSAAQDNAARIWDVHSGKVIAVLRSSDDLSTAAYSPDGHVVATASNDWTARLWRSDTGKPIATLPGRSFVQAVAFSPDGRLAATAGGSATVHLWNARSGHLIADLTAPRAGVHRIAFVPGSHLLAALGHARVLQLWDTRSHRPAASAKLAATGRRLALSADGHAIATGGDSGQVELWDARTVRRLAPLSGQRFGITALRFSADGRTLVSAAGDDSIRLWDVGSGRPLDKLDTETEVNDLAVSPDGTFLVAGGSAHAGRIWRNIGWRNAGDLRDKVCHVSGGGLSRVEWAEFAPGLPYRNHCAMTAERP